MLPETLIENPTVAALYERFPDGIESGSDSLGQTALFVNPAKLVDICRFLKMDLRFERLSGVTAVDWWPQEPRFEVVYHLHSIQNNTRLRLKAKVVGENPEIDSVTAVWRSANWYEREVFDLFGIAFRNHPNLERIMMPADWEGHPLRKDYPIHGYKYSYPEA